MTIRRPEWPQKPPPAINQTGGLLLAGCVSLPVAQPKLINRRRGLQVTSWGSLRACGRVRRVQRRPFVG